MRAENKDRLALRMNSATKQKIEQWYAADNCRSKNEFVEKAVNFYADYLAAGFCTTLPKSIVSAIDGRLSVFEDRMARLLYAAEHGSHCAAYRAGKEYLRGEFAKRDVSKAVSYLDSAACDGNSYAQYLLGKLYLEGREIHQNKETARYWLTQSTNQGNGYAQFLLDHIDSVQPPSVLLAATHLLHNMANIFRDNSLPKTGNIGFRIDKKRLQKLRDKRIALGHKPDDHEESQWPSMSM